MDAGETERELDELETRIERLRALYEQYFMGLEKLEPLIPRKEVERRIWVLRREQIRNTGLRFKFQMLVQRFNTFQQYWSRVAREIENGTYRRDVIRAARRFGVKEALTILGRKRAQQFAALAAAQEARRRPGEEEEDLLADEDLLEEDEDLLEGRDHLEEELGDEHLEDVSDDLDAVEDETPTPATLHYPRRHSPLPPPRLLPPPPLSPTAPPELSSHAAPESSPPEPPTAKRQARVAKPAPPPKPSDADAAKRRLVELAAQVRSTRIRDEDAEPAGGPLELDLDFDGPRTVVPRKTTKPPPRRSSSASRGTVRPPSTSAPSSKAASSNTAPPRKPDAARGDLEEKRLRQIYAKYIETKRAVNEPTAGITFEKLAESLRAQAAKLRATHPSKSVDYEVVVKNGKTLLRPILRGGRG